VGWPGAADAVGAADGADDAAPFAEPDAARPEAAVGVTLAPGLADALAADDDGERPQPLSTPAAPATATTAIGRTEPIACVIRAIANLRFIKVIVTARIVGQWLSS
jgi:hypothetical protein